jgi:hypothetical protein
MADFRGFDIKLNLSENVADAVAIDNLAGSNMSLDLARFINNKRNASVLVITSGQINTGTGLITFTEPQPFLFTNGTKITVNDDVFFVGDSDASTRFRLFSDQNLLTPVLSPPAGTYIRSDAVSFTDITNLLKSRFLVVEDISSSQLGLGNQAQSDIYSSYIRVYDVVRGGFLTGFSAYARSIDAENDLFFLRKQRSISQLTDFNRDGVISLEGSIYISDPDDVNLSSVETSFLPNKPPGIFILNTETGEAERIFSSNENVWVEDGSDLVAATDEIFIGNFVFNDGVRITGKDSSYAVTSETGSVAGIVGTAERYFVTAKINGEEYSLFLK